MKTKIFEECLNNLEFRNFIDIMTKLNKVDFFDELLLKKMKTFKLTDNMTMYDFFVHGLNSGYCGFTVLLLSLMFDDCSIVFGKNDYIKGTENSPNGEHAWLKVNDKIYDTSLGLVFKGNGLGYEESFSINKSDLNFIYEYAMMDELFKKNLPVLFKDNLSQEIIEKVLSLYIDKRDYKMK